MSRYEAREDGKSYWLTREEVERLTDGKVRYKAQCRALDARGIKYIRAGKNKDGEPLVRRADLDADGKPKQASGHRWDRIGGVRQLRT